jgi:hypothetical protein
MSNENNTVDDAINKDAANKKIVLLDLNADLDAQLNGFFSDLLNGSKPQAATTDLGEPV